jgi:23S rRNA pseudouridine1911/1915/1917 synthase
MGDNALTILYEDKHCLVAAKPARLLTASDETGDETLLAQARAYHFARQAPGKKGYLVPVHFLDRPVSGAVIFALSSKAAARLGAQLKGRAMEKVYCALVEGKAPAPSGELSDWLLKDHDANLVTVVPPGTADAKACKLAYRVLAEHGGLTLLEVRPATGRSHQIRVQLSSRGMPIFGDVKYGASAPWDGRIALHAWSVTFAHPVGQAPVTVTAPVPPYWAELGVRLPLVREKEETQRV